MKRNLKEKWPNIISSIIQTSSISIFHSPILLFPRPLPSSLFPLCHSHPPYNAISPFQHSIFFLVHITHALLSSLSLSSFTVPFLRFPFTYVPTLLQDIIFFSLVTVYSYTDLSMFASSSSSSSSSSNRNNFKRYNFHFLLEPGFQGDLSARDENGKG